MNIFFSILDVDGYRKRVWNVKKIILSFCLLLLLIPVLVFIYVVFSYNYRSYWSPKHEYYGALSRAEKGEPEAQVAVADVLARGCELRGTIGWPWGLGILFQEWHLPCNKDEALKWYRLAAEKGNPQAQEDLGFIYAEGDYGISQDLTAGISWYRKAAEQGSVRACEALGELYFKGKRVKQDYAEAAKWYRKAAEHGSAHAQINLAEMYMRGQGVQKNTKMAREWGLKAAKQGEMYKQSQLAEIYANTEPADYNEAYYWAYFARERYRNGGGYGLGAKKSLQDFESHLTSEQITTIQKHVEEDLARYCFVRGMGATCKRDTSRSSR